MISKQGNVANEGKQDSPETADNSRDQTEVPSKTEVANAHASGDGSLKRSDEEQNRFPGGNVEKGSDQY